MPDSVLATPPDVLTTLAERALSTAAEAQRLRAVLGQRPRLDADAEQRAMAEWQALVEERRAATTAREERVRFMTMGNTAGVGWLATAVGLALAVRQPMGTTIDLAMTLAATSPVAGFVTGSTRARRARAAVARRRLACAEALEQAGVKTMGELRARRVVVDSWSRRRDAARLAQKQAADALTAWHEVAGPDFSPHDVELLLQRCVEMRREALARLRELMAAEHERRKLEVQAAVAEVLTPFPAVVRALPAGGRVGAGLERLQGLRLRLWRTA